MNAENHCHIVIVEDDDELRSVLADFLKTVDYPIVTFPSFVEALQDMRSGSLRKAIENKMAPIIISDNLMPGMDGMAFLKITRQEFPQTPFVLMTAFGSDEFKQKAKDAGVFGFIKKPFELNELESLVSKAQAQIRLSQKEPEGKKWRNCRVCSCDSIERKIR